MRNDILKGFFNLHTKVKEFYSPLRNFTYVYVCIRFSLYDNNKTTTYFYMHYIFVHDVMKSVTY